MAEAWRFFRAEVRRVEALSPHFVRVTFTGDDLDRFADNGFDQRIKLILPLRDDGFAHMPTHPDWYAAWRALPDHRRNPVRTYTVRAVRPQLREVDLDMVLHGATGPASRWAVEVAPGDAACLMGPDKDFGGVHGGVDFRPPRRTGSLLIGGDETAVPAIISILKGLPPYASGQALIEVPCPDDVLDLVAPPGMRVTWLARDEKPHGALLIPSIKAAAARMLGPAGPPTDLEDVDVDTDTLWEVPEPAVDVSRFYAWLAGEAGMIKTLRRFLVSECGVDRGSVAFMGYWRLGRPEDI